MKKKLETKQVALVRQKLDNALEAVNKVSIKSDTEYEQANEMLANVKQVGRYLVQEKKKQLDPAMATVKAIRDFWKPFEEKYSKAETILKSAVLKYKQRLDARIAQKEATISKKVDEGKLSFEKGVEKMGEVAATPTTHAGVQARKIKKVRFQQLDHFTPKEIGVLIADGYIIWDQVKARRDALNGRVIPGVTVYEEEIISA